MPERAILFLAIAQTLIWASASYSFAALLLWWEADFGWSRSQLTGAFTVALLISAVSAPIVGRLIDQGKGAVVMGVSTACAGLLVGSLSLVHEIWQFYLIWIAIGISISGCLYEPCFAIITRARGQNGRRAIVVITLFAGFASTISFPLADYMSESAGWRAAVYLFAAISVFVAAPLNFLGARKIETEVSDAHSVERNNDPGGSRGKILMRPEFWLLGLAFAFGAMLQQISINHLLAILQERNILKDIAVLAAASIGPMQVAGRIAMVMSGEKASNHLVAICAFMAMTCSAFFLMMIGYSVLFVILFVVFFGAAHGVVSIVRPGLTLQILGAKDYGRKSGLLASFFFLGGATAPFSGALIWRAGGYDAVLAVLVLLGLSGLICYLLAHKIAEIRQEL